ncbi:hypothetical protein Fmac_006520 [Flemingia macrophylla]|uniref:Uncharacterized protein n=1 Tax=Flemingia macrophylla TaxID=520843 RepID=A0ABD1NAW1_9FABA
MVQVDLVSACAGGASERKIACESQATADPPAEWESPPESVWLSRDEEYEWWERNAVYERKESTKANSNSGTNSNSNSQRFSLNFKSTIIGLPKPHKTSFADRRHHHKPSNTRLFPKRTVSVGKSDVEPSSPKVSCMGRVRSKRKSSRTPNAKTKKPGFFRSFRAMFRRERKPDPNVAAAESNNVRARDSTSSVNDLSYEEAVSRRSAVSESGLGGMKRFASGRRSESWAVGADSQGHVPR